MYFKNFPTINFLVSPPGYKKAAHYVSAVDITVNIKFLKQIIDNITLYDYYNISDGETLELISENLYGSPHYNWILMILNNIFDYRNDYIMSGKVFEKYITEKYGSVDQAKNQVYAYRNSDGIYGTQYGFAVDGINRDEEQTNTEFIPVSAYDYEFEKNEEKRRIKVVSKNIISLILKNFRDVL